QIKSLENIFPEEKFVLLGHSLGSLIAIEIAKRFPNKIEKLILLSPPSIEDRADLKQILKNQSKWESIMALDSIWAPLACHIHELLGPLSFYLMRPFVSKNLPDFIVRDATKHRWRSYNQSLNNIILSYRAIDHLNQLTIDHLILAGDEDGYTKNDRLQNLNNVQLIPGGHNFLWDNPQKTLAIISKYLQN
ncbi:MAG: alpha/beta hydrolase, partial [Bdellovibrionales bacterium]|nr:alpha/beta hydrolase [Bdellovibrionales bacterium]